MRRCRSAGKQVVVDMPPADHATGGTDYYLPVLQHMWLTPYAPPMRNDVLLDDIVAAGHTPIASGTTLVKLLQAEDGTVTGALLSHQGRLRAGQRRRARCWPPAATRRTRR